MRHRFSAQLVIALAGALLLVPATARATAQVPDTLRYKGEWHSIFTNPLEAYFGKEHPRPDKLFPATCTANWRGYIAHWEIRDGWLYLTKLVEGGCANRPPEIPLEKVFPGRKGPLKAVWFTGTLRIPRGKQLKYIHMGYASIYERELHIRVEKGQVVSEKTIDNSDKVKPPRKQPESAPEK